MRYFISAGEASGDIHASHLITSIRDLDASAEFAFLGGDLMREAAGCEPVIDYRKMAFMGFSEVLRNLRQILRNFKTARRAIDSFKPDALILVDYPSFNLKLAKYAHSLGIPVYYYIAPKVWAWKSWRVKQLRKYVSKILSILPFEPEWFEARGVKVDYVGNPSVEEIRARINSLPAKGAFMAAHGLDVDKPMLALVPGSRRGEIRCNLPVMLEVAKRHGDMQAVITAAPGIDRSIYDEVFERIGMQAVLIENQTTAIMKFAEAALVTSGTATLECALCFTPQVACYRANGSKLSYNIMKKLIKCPFVTLPNLIAGREVIPEMLVHLCTPHAVDAKLTSLLSNTPQRQEMFDGYELVSEKLGTGHTADAAATKIYDELKELQ